MTRQPMTIAVHRASDRKPLTIDVEQIQYFQAVTHDRAPLTKVALFAGDEVAQESASKVRQLCRVLTHAPPWNTVDALPRAVTRTGKAVRIIELSPLGVRIWAITPTNPAAVFCNAITSRVVSI